MRKREMKQKIERLERECASLSERLESEAKIADRALNMVERLSKSFDARMKSIDEYFDMKEADEEAGKLMQQGIDSIMGFQWPPVKRDCKE